MSKPKLSKTVRKALERVTVTNLVAKAVDDALADVDAFMQRQGAPDDISAADVRHYLTVGLEVLRAGFDDLHRDLMVAVLQDPAVSVRVIEAGTEDLLAILDRYLNEEDEAVSDIIPGAKPEN